MARHVLNYCITRQSIQMKKFLVFVTLLAILFSNKLLKQYYGLKDALVAGNATSAAQYAEQLVKTLNGIDYKLISEGNINALLKDASGISASNDLKRQRVSFANLSENMISLAKAIKLSDQPIYQVYCPMKKASWLSNEQEIKNPYYGATMLTCGKVVETIKESSN